jgi:hypothetical protein
MSQRFSNRRLRGLEQVDIQMYLLGRFPHLLLQSLVEDTGESISDSAKSSICGSKETFFINGGAIPREKARWAQV